MLSAMSGDGTGSGARRPRVISRPRVSPGPLADLKALIYELYLAAGTPTLDEITAVVAADDELAGAPGRDTIARIIGGPGMPASQADVAAVAIVLARAARWDPGDAAGRARDLWIAVRMATPAGVPLGEVTDPFALEVHGRPCRIRSRLGCRTFRLTCCGNTMRHSPGSLRGPRRAAARSRSWSAAPLPARPGPAGKRCTCCEPSPGHGGYGIRSTRPAPKPRWTSCRGSGRAQWCG